MGLSDMLGEVYDEGEEEEINAAPADPPAAEEIAPPSVTAPVAVEEPEVEPVSAQPLVIETEPEPLVAEVVIEPPVAESVPEPLVIEPEPLVAEVVIEPPVAESVPEPLVIETEPEPLVAEVVIEPPVAESVPEPLVIEPEPEPLVAESAPEPLVIETEPEPLVAESAPEPLVIETEPEPLVAEVVVEPPIVEPAPLVIEAEPEPFMIEPEADLEEGVFSDRATPGPDWANEDALDAAFADWQPEEGMAPVDEQPFVGEPAAVLLVEPEPEPKPVKPKRRGLFGRSKKQEQTAPDEGDVHLPSEPVEVMDITDVPDVEVIESLESEEVAASELAPEAIDEFETEPEPEVSGTKKQRRGFFGRSKKPKQQPMDELVLSDLAGASLEGITEEDVVAVAAAPRGPIMSDDLLPNRKGRK